MATITVVISYTTLGVLLPIAMDTVEPMSTLNWRGYTAGYAERPWYAYMIEYIIVLFPA